MKKLKYVLIAMIIFLPIKIWAISVSKTEITGNGEVNALKIYPYDIKISFSDLNKKSTEGQGISSIIYELSFDNKLLGVTEISSKGRWDSKLYTENGKYYVLSTISEYSDEVGKCSDGILFCDSYEATISFYAKKVSKNQKTSVKISNIETALLPLISDVNTITEEDFSTISKKDATTKNITIKKNASGSGDSFTEIKMEKGKPSVKSADVLNIIKELTPVSGKSKNNLLTKLEIVGYEIEFNKYYNDYYIVAKENTNKLEVKYTVADKKAKVKVIGNDDLKANNNEVLIEVTSEDGETNTYRIKVGFEEKENDETKTNNFFNLKINIEDKYLKIAGIVFGGLVLITLIIWVIFKIKDHKMEKQLDKL